jgi:hypothetical protein
MKTTLCNIVILVVMIIMVTSCGSRSNEVNNNSPLPEVTGISLDSLCSMGIEVTLWAESKPNYENLIGKKLTQLGWSTEFFAAPTTGWTGEFDWPAVKPHMLWQGKNIAIFKNSLTKRFVVIGSYSTNSPYILNFGGYLYEY